MIYIVLALIALSSAAAVLVPLWRQQREAPHRASHDVAVFKAQLAEVDRDADKGTISETEAEGARREISRRLLAAAEEADLGETIQSAPAALAHRVALALGIVMSLGAASLYAVLGSPGQPSVPLAERDFAAERRALRPSQVEAELQRSAAEAEQPAQAESDPEGKAEAERLIGQVRQKLAERPEDVEGRLLLARALGQLERYAEVYPLYREARGLLGEADPALIAELAAAEGEAMVLAAGGYVSPEAEEVFTLAPSRPRSRYFLALSAFQLGERAKAAAEWQLLIDDFPEAPFVPLIREQLAATGLSAPASGAQSSSAQSPSAKSPSAQASGDGGSGGDAAATEEPLAARGPTAEDIQAAQRMTADDRMAMIRGMVDGLDERLAEGDGTLDEWKQLIRSLGILDEVERAGDAYRRAVAQFPTEEAQAELATVAQEAGVEL